MKAFFFFGFSTLEALLHQDPDMEGSTRVGSAEWEEEWVMCSCNLCKWQKKRRRRIAMEHVKQHGEFDRRLFDEARRHGTVIHDAHTYCRCITPWI